MANTLDPNAAYDMKEMLGAIGAGRRSPSGTKPSGTTPKVDLAVTSTQPKKASRRSKKDDDPEKSTKRSRGPARNTTATKKAAAAAAAVAPVPKKKKKKKKKKKVVATDVEMEDAPAPLSFDGITAPHRGVKGQPPAQGGREPKRIRTGHEEMPSQRLGPYGTTTSDIDMDDAPPYPPPVRASTKVRKSSKDADKEPPKDEDEEEGGGKPRVKDKGKAVATEGGKKPVRRGTTG